MINNYPLEFSMPLKEAKAMRKIICKAQESHGLTFTEEKGVKVGRLQYYDFKITSYTTSFASGYFNIGILYAKYVLPIWNKRHRVK